MPPSLRRFEGVADFFRRTGVPAQLPFAKNPNIAIMGEYPTLAEVNASYGGGIAESWLCVHIVDLCTFTGAKNPSEAQVYALASLIATQYYYLKITELMLFFFRFKAGFYGQFYGRVDPLVITTGLRSFVRERNVVIDRIEEERNKRRKERTRNLANGLSEYMSLVESHHYLPFDFDNYPRKIDPGYKQTYLNET